MNGRFDFLRLIDLVYEAAADVRNWANAMIAVAAALGAPAMSLTIVDAERKETPFVVAPRTDPAWLRTFLDRWAAANIVRERGLAIPVGVPYRFEDLLARPEFERTAFYNEFWAPQQLSFALFANLAKEQGAVAGIGFYRSLREGPFAPEDERLLAALAPHLERAVALNLRLRRLEIERDGAAEMLDRCAHGALLVDAEARILFANAAAETLLREGKGLRSREGRLAASLPANTAALRRLVAGGDGGIAGGLMALPSRDGGSLTVRVLPLAAETAGLAKSAAAIVFVKDPQAVPPPSRDRLQALFGLTPAQAALAREILEGDGVQAAAERLGISRSTARTHLLEVFQKTGTSRQAELVRVVFERSLPAHLAPVPDQYGERHHRA
jgi:DNA-binding CsgD family transcriptional regulator